MTDMGGYGQPTRKNRSGRGPGEAGAEYEPIWSRERPVLKGNPRKSRKILEVGSVEFRDVLKIGARLVPAMLVRCTESRFVTLSFVASQTKESFVIYF